MKFSSRRLAVKLPNMCKRNDLKFDNTCPLCLRPFGVTNVFSLSENNVHPKEANSFAPKINLYLTTSNNHRLESAGLNALEELLRCWECTEKIVKPACVF